MLLFGFVMDSQVVSTLLSPPSEVAKGINLCQVLLTEDPKHITDAPPVHQSHLQGSGSSDIQPIIWLQEKLLQDNDAIGASQMMAS